MIANNSLLLCSCKACGYRIQFDQSKIGSSLSCPDCATEVILFPSVSPIPGSEPPLTLVRPKPSPNKLTPCPECAHPISRSAETCPHCGFALVPKLDFGRKCVYGTLSVAGTLVVLWIIYSIVKFCDSQ